MASKKIAKTVAIVTVFACITRFLSFIFKIYLSRYLGAEVLGLYQICISLFVLLACFSASGLPLTLSRKTAENEVLGNTVRAKQMFTATLLTAMLTAGAFCLFFYFFPGLLNRIFSDERCTKMFLFMLPALLTTSVYSVTRAWFWGKKDYVVYSVAETLDEIFKILFTIFFISAIFSYEKEMGLAIAFLASDVACALTLLLIFLKKSGKPARPKYFPEILKSSAPITSTRILSSFTTSITALMLPVLLVSMAGMTTAGATAAYGRASGMVMPMVFAPNSLVGALSIVLLPEVASLKVKDEKKRLNSSINNALLFACFCGCAFFAVYFSAGRELGVLLYNDALAGEYLRVAAFLTLPMCVNQISLTCLNTLGQETKSFKSNLAGLFVLLIVTLGAPKFLGVYAYFAGLFGYHFTTFGINLYFLHKHGKIKLSSLKKMPLIAAISVAALISGKLVYELVYTKLPNLATVAIVTSTVVSVYMLACTLFGLVNFKRVFGKQARPAESGQ